MNLLKNFKVYDLVVISLMAALGIAVKIVVTPLAHMISGPLNMPGGALAGGFYMFWIVLAGGLVGKRGATTLTALIQALMVLVIGTAGSHGIMSIVTYTLPGLMVDCVFLITRREIKSNMDFFIGGMVANMTGTLLTGSMFFRLPMLTLVMIVASGMLSGGLGGLIAHATYVGVNQMESTEELKEVTRKKSFKGLVLILAAALIVIALAIYTVTSLQINQETKADQYSHIEMMQPLLVSGDVIHEGYIQDLPHNLILASVEADDLVSHEINMLTFLESIGVPDTTYEIFLIANDGFMVGVHSTTLTNTKIAYNALNGWQFLSEKHPINSKVKQMVEIVVVSDEPVEDFNVIRDNTNNFYSRGALRMEMNQQVSVYDGQSAYKETSIDVMKNKSVMPLSQLMDVTESVLIVTESGEMIYQYHNGGYFEYSSSGVRYHTEDFLETYQNIQGIYINPYVTSIKDNYFDAEYYINKGIRVMTLFVDGFSYEQYQALITDDQVDFIDNLEGVEPALVGYRPVTNVGFATMVTGVNPSEHGILDRSGREVHVETIFDLCNDLGRSSGLIEGNTNILMLDTDVTLSLDNNNNGFTDDEIQEAALGKIKDYDYFMVHYHGVDEMGHDYGPHASETIDHLKAVDTYIEALVAQWDGKVILLSDHGMHKTYLAGDHGDFRVEDMVVPYVVFDGGLYEK